MLIDGKRVLITGGTSGIGLEIAKALLKRGARVAVTGRDGDRLRRSLSELATVGSVIGIRADVCLTEDRTAAIEKTLEAFGGLDILVNNAGGVRAGRLENITEREIRAMIEVDLIAPILLTQAALAHLRASGDGLIVNVASSIALIGVPFYAPYAAAKAGLARFSEAMRRELKEEGIHVLTLYPGATDTPMMHSSHAGPDLGFAKEPPSEVAMALVEGIKADTFEVIRGGENRAKLIATNRESPAVIDEHFLRLKIALEEAVRSHSAL